VSPENIRQRGDIESRLGKGRDGEAFQPAKVFRLELFRFRVGLLFFDFRLADVDRCCIQRVLEMHGVVLLDHLDARAAVLCKLINIGPFKQAKADVRVTQAVRRTSVAIAVKLEIFLGEQGIEDAGMASRKNTIGSLGLLR